MQPSSMLLGAKREVFVDFFAQQNGPSFRSGRAE